MVAMSCESPISRNKEMFPTHTSVGKKCFRMVSGCCEVFRGPNFGMGNLGSDRKKVAQNGRGWFRMGCGLLRMDADGCGWVSEGCGRLRKPNFRNRAITPTFDKNFRLVLSEGF